MENLVEVHLNSLSLVIRVLLLEPVTYFLIKSEKMFFIYIRDIAFGWIICISKGYDILSGNLVSLYTNTFLTGRLPCDLIFI